MLRSSLFEYFAAREEKKARHTRRRYPHVDATSMKVLNLSYDVATCLKCERSTKSSLLQRSVVYRRWKYFLHTFKACLYGEIY